jgi:hypothetical protein
MSTASLFPESVDMRKQRLGAEMDHLLLRRPGGPLKIPLEDSEKAVLDCLRYRYGIRNAMTIREIQLRTQLDPRTIKQSVRTLRINFRMPIGSWKHADKGGYFIILDDEDRSAWVKDVLDQVRAEVGVLKAAAGRQAGLELLGQLQIEIEQEEAHA